MTSTERKSEAIARQLVKVLKKIESFDGDADMIFTDALVFAHDEKELKRFINHVLKYYDIDPYEKNVDSN